MRRFRFTATAAALVVLTTIALAPTNSLGAMITLQPSAADLKDTWIWDTEDFSHGGERELRVNDTDSFDQRVLIEFSDLSAIPGTATINSALLMLYRYDGSSAGTFVELSAFEITSAWAESVTFSTAPSISATAEDVINVSNVDGWYSWDLTSLAQEWVDGAAANNGVMIYNSSGTANTFFQRFASADIGGPGDGPSHPGAAFTPKLVIDYSPIVVPEPTSLTLFGLGALGAIGAARRRRKAG